MLSLVETIDDFSHTVIFAVIQLIVSDDKRVILVHVFEAAVVLKACYVVRRDEVFADQDVSAAPIEADLFGFDQRAGRNQFIEDDVLDTFLEIAVLHDILLCVMLWTIVQAPLLEGA